MGQDNIFSIRDSPNSSHLNFSTVYTHILGLAIKNGKKPIIELTSTKHCQGRILKRRKNLAVKYADMSTRPSLTDVSP